MKRYWFKAKNYGWGWYPATYEGWIILGIYLFILWIVTSYIKDHFGDMFIVPHIIVVTILTTLLIIICYQTGEKPEWRWGSKKKKNR